MVAGYRLPDTPGKLGGAGTEMLRFAAVGEGRAMLALFYVRPWKSAAAPAKSFSLEVNVAESSRNVSVPQPAAQEPLEAATDGASLEALPAAYNWCDLGGCTPGARLGPVWQLLGFWHRKLVGIGHPAPGWCFERPGGAVPGLV